VLIGILLTPVSGSVPSFGVSAVHPKQRVPAKLTDAVTRDTSPILTNYRYYSER